MIHYSIEPGTRMYVQGCEFSSFLKNLFNIYGKHLLNTATKTEQNSLETASEM